MVVLLQELLLIATPLSLPMTPSQSSFRSRASGKHFHQQTHESNRNKRIRQTLGNDDSSEVKEIKDDDSEKIAKQSY
jgi:hypothetical protein